MTSHLLDFEWKQCIALDEVSMNELCHLAPRRPPKAPGEAWFMGATRKRFDEFVKRPIADIPVDYIINWLFDITSGISCFSDCTDEVAHWKSWYRHLLPSLVQRSQDHHISFLIEGLITAFMQIYREDPDDEFPGLRNSALQTIGKALMKPEFWNEDVPIWAEYHNWWRVDGLPRAAYCSGALSASLFYCLRYLKPSQIPAWTSSLLNINSVHFRAHFLTWLAATYDWFSTQQRTFSQFEKLEICVKWGDSFLLESADVGITSDCSSEFLNTVRQKLSANIAMNWLEQIWNNDSLSEPFRGTGIGEIILTRVLRDA